MDPDLKEMLFDIKAAEKIGSDDAFISALDGLMGWELVAGNHRYDLVFFQKILLPLAEALASSHFPPEFLAYLLHSDYAAYRTVAYCTYILQSYTQKIIASSVASQLGKESRADLIEAVQFLLQKHWDKDPTLSSQLLKLVSKE